MYMYLRFSTFSFGCRVNQAENEAMIEKLLKAGLVYDKDRPDVLIVNTCAVTGKAEREARQLIYRLKKQFPKSILTITGCSATYWQSNNIYKNLPVDLIISNKNKEKLPKILIDRLSEQADFDRRGQTRPITASQTASFFDKFLNSGRSILKIQDGCQRFCSYCIVPYLRGKPKSKKIEDIIKEIKTKEKRVKEVILTAINTEAFGFDTGENLVELIKAILEKTKIKRLSFGSINPWSIDEKFLAFYKTIKDSDRFVHFFHIPLQSGSNKILKLMKRGYETKEFIDKVTAIKKINPRAMVATDVIVGFLGEGKKEFQETHNFLKKAPVDKFHIFRFSKRKGTSAYFMANKLKEPTEAEKRDRSKTLIELGKEKYQKFLKKHVGKEFSALFLEERIGKYQKCLLGNQVLVFVKTKEILPGKIKNVKITELKRNVLFGRISNSEF